MSYIIVDKDLDIYLFQVNTLNYVEDDKFILHEGTKYQVDKINIYEVEMQAETTDRYYYDDKFYDITKEERDQANSQIFEELEETDNSLIRLIEDIAIWAEERGFVIPQSKADLIQERANKRNKIK